MLFADREPISVPPAPKEGYTRFRCRPEETRENRDFHQYKFEILGEDIFFALSSGYSYPSSGMPDCLVWLGITNVGGLLDCVSLLVWNF
jgi:hypothetical protein